MGFVECGNIVENWQGVKNTISAYEVVSTK